jgi:hypothetical protein
MSSADPDTSCPGRHANPRTPDPGATAFAAGAVPLQCHPHSVTLTVATARGLAGAALTATVVATAVFVRPMMAAWPPVSVGCAALLALRGCRPAGHGPAGTAQRSGGPDEPTELVVPQNGSAPTSGEDER